MKKLFTILLMLAQSFVGLAQTTSTFEGLPLDVSGYWNGSDETGGFSDGDAYFQNKYTKKYGSWQGFAYSNTTDVTTGDFTNQYSAWTGAGVGHSKKYAVFYGSGKIILTGDAKTKPVTGFYVANTTYTALVIKNGDDFGAKPFGGETGNDPDYLQLAITGYRNKAVISDTVKIKLADYTFSDNSKDYILNTWRWVDLRSLGVVDSLTFILSSTDNAVYNGISYMNTPNYFAMDHFNEPLYDAAVINGGTKAIAKDSELFKSWANACSITRGYQDIAVGGAFASVGEGVDGTLKAGVNGVVSLGDKGTAVLQFPVPIKNGDGPDFAVFENGFNLGGAGTNQFLELAFVEVSSDGINYVRFPAISKTNSVAQTGGFGGTDAALLHNFAGKYVANYGTPFDLDELKNNTKLDVNNIIHVKIIDVIGTIDAAYSTKDSLHNTVNDPYPTAFPSSGFDLDAVGVINQNDLATSVSYASEAIFSIYPNPSTNEFKLSLLNTSFAGQALNVFDAQGVELVNQVIADTNVIDAALWNNGIYFVRVGNNTQKIVKID